MDGNKRSWWPYGWSHRDTIWLLIWLGTVAMLSISFLLGNNSAALGYISFASTLISIMLALVAIFYTMVQASDSNQVMAAMKERLDQVSSQTNTLLNLRPLSLSDDKRVAAALADAPPASTAPTIGIGDTPSETRPETTDGTPAARAVRGALNIMKQLIREAIYAAPPGVTVRVSKTQLIESVILSGVELADAIMAFNQLCEEHSLTGPVEPDLYWVHTRRFTVNTKLSAS